MITEIKLRLVDIQRTLTGVRSSAGYPSSIGHDILPVFVNFPIRTTNARLAGETWQHVVTFEMRLYVASAGTGTSVMPEYELYDYTDDIFNLFMTRPRLQYLDNGLTGVHQDISFGLTRGFNTGLKYPVNASGSDYWGAVFEISVPYLRRVTINHGGA